MPCPEERGPPEGGTGLTFEVRYGENTRRVSDEVGVIEELIEYLRFPGVYGKFTVEEVRA